MRKQLRQGDILLEQAVDIKMPDGLASTPHLILAEGELTGHCHILAAPRVFEWEKNGQRYVRVAGGIGTISHQEHDPMPAPVIEKDTTYRVIPQQEWNLEQQWRKVID